MAVINGTNGNDNLGGTTKNDTIYGKNGDDWIWGWDGNDSLHGDKGNDTLLGENGNDNLYGKDGDDYLSGGAGNDSLHGDAGFDYVYGDAGNDTVKGGTGISYLNGGTGDDKLYYDPTTGKLEDIGNFLSPSHMTGEDGYDQLNVFNKAKYTGLDGKSHDAETYIWIDDSGIGHIDFGGQPEDGYTPYVNAGTFSHVEEIKLDGKGGATFWGAWTGYDTTITGTAKADTFSSYYADDTMIGGGGNDTFYLNGADKVVSGGSDADDFYMSAWYSYDTATIENFNGEGKSGGDQLYLNSYEFTGLYESGGKTTFYLNWGTDAVQVDAVGMVQGEDWFLI